MSLLRSEELFLKVRGFILQGGGASAADGAGPCGARRREEKKEKKESQKMKGRRAVCESCLCLLQGVEQLLKEAAAEVQATEAPWDPGPRMLPPSAVAFDLLPRLEWVRPRRPRRPRASWASRPPRPPRRSSRPGTWQGQAPVKSKKKQLATITNKHASRVISLHPPALAVALLGGGSEGQPGPPRCQESLGEAQGTASQCLAASHVTWKRSERVLSMKREAMGAGEGARHVKSEARAPKRTKKHLSKSLPTVFFFLSNSVFSVLSRASHSGGGAEQPAAKQRSVTAEVRGKPSNTKRALFKNMCVETQTVRSQKPTRHLSSPPVTS